MVLTLVSASLSLFQRICLPLTVLLEHLWAEEREASWRTGMWVVPSAWRLIRLAGGACQSNSKRHFEKGTNRELISGLNGFKSVSGGCNSWVSGGEHKLKVMPRRFSCLSLSAYPKRKRCMSPSGPYQCKRTWKDTASPILFSRALPHCPPTLWTWKVHLFWAIW